MFLRRPELPAWQGAGLAIEVIKQRLEQIRGALQPPRPDVIAPATDEALEMLTLLEQFLASQPPGSAYFQHSHKRLPPTGGAFTQQSQVSGRQAAIDREAGFDAEEREWRGDPQA